MSKTAADHHRKASEHSTPAANHHGEAAKQHDAGQQEKAGHTATGHERQSTEHVTALEGPIAFCRTFFQSYLFSRYGRVATLSNAKFVKACYG